ncbi:AAA family ATPase [Patescibacteria group bacterium]|nr:AAA family ATPase [Patescibacteria group bacterium]
MPNLLDHTPAFDAALSLMEAGGPFTFVTGRAGTGKSTLLKHFRETTELIAPVLAPTGVAALNVGGETIHRFFLFPPNVTVKHARSEANTTPNPEIYQNADILIIDEISMVRADLLDCMDQFLRIVRKRKAPFGGLRIVAIGDLYQLPPVITNTEREAFAELYDSPYFFASRVMQELFAMGGISCIELEKIYRQKDKTFVALLNAVRDRTVTEKQLQKLNTRLSTSPPKDAIVLTAINASAETLNTERLAQLPGSIQTFEGEFRGAFPERETPSDAILTLKKNARVMCVANDPHGRFVNGSLGWVVDFGVDEDVGPSVIVKLDTGGIVSVSAHLWNIYRSVYDSFTRTLDQEKMGSFSQIPLKLAWAVTIHKSQGKTFDQVTIDLGRGAFASGQTYVALSRCRTLKGIHLKQPVRLHDIRLDESIGDFMTQLEQGSATLF